MNEVLNRGLGVEYSASKHEKEREDFLLAGRLLEQASRQFPKDLAADAQQIAKAVVALRSGLEQQHQESRGKQSQYFVLVPVTLLNQSSGEDGSCPEGQ
ncbi:hypothetical protein [Thiothrix winogradskyi]|uniref:Uncharacterized protein n=1 Tax=Thiothrix winogradskyi TaxID=96472 RepID=A0ABY3T323_9GAMM|nr:hypothetical protein [Thiothrix winogradskyi]UJS26257.1 hypothetical protein L2Y54_09520 [Thiothrix winogradskyi]